MPEIPDNVETSSGGTWHLAISTVLALPFAAATGAFAGWCLGASAGQWLELLGIQEASHEGGILGGIVGAVVCAAYIAFRTLNDHSEADHG
jgi:hypothetical protein